MKKTKLIAAALAAILLLLPLTNAAYATSTNNDMLGGLIDALTELLGGNTPGGNFTVADLFTNPDNVLNDIRDRLGTQIDDAALIEAIANVIGNATAQFNLDDLLNNDFLNRLRKYLNIAEIPDSTAGIQIPTATLPPTTAYTPAPTTAYNYVTQAPAASAYSTAPATVAVMTTAPAAAQASTTTTNAASASTLPTVSMDAASTFTQSVPASGIEFATAPTFSTAAVTEAAPQKNSTAKTVLGVFILLLSFGAVVAVAIILRKSKV